MRASPTCCTAPSARATVADAMVRRPKTVPVTATLAEVAAALSDDHVHLVLVVEGTRLFGTVTREDLDVALSSCGAAAPAAGWSRLEGRTVRPGAALPRVHAAMVERGSRRLAVVDEAGTLLGLLCLKRSLDGFCSDRDVAARASGSRVGPAEETVGLPDGHVIAWLP